MFCDLKKYKLNWTQNRLVPISDQFPTDKIREPLIDQVLRIIVVVKKKIKESINLKYGKELDAEGSCAGGNFKYTNETSSNISAIVSKAEMIVLSRLHCTTTSTWPFFSYFELIKNSLILMFSLTVKAFIVTIFTLLVWIRTIPGRILSHWLSLLLCGAVLCFLYLKVRF